MTIEEIICKGEEQLNYIYGLTVNNNSTEWARIGLSQLNMLSYILDEEYKKYDEWFNKFNAYM